MEEGQNMNLDQQQEAYYGVGSFLWEVVKIFFWAFVIIMPVRIFLFQPFFVQGASMEPNFKEGDYLIVNEFGFKQTTFEFEGIKFLNVKPFRDLKRGDIIVFRYPRNPQQFFIKRVVALPGEEIKIKSGKVEIINSDNPNGFALDEETYLSLDVSTKGDVDYKVKQGEYFVLGDNRDQSHDSRAWGPVNEDKVIGKVLLRAWPLNKAGIF